MIIGVDGNEANVEQKVGSSVYTAELLKYFRAHASPQLKFVVYVRKALLPGMPEETEHFKYEIVPGQKFWRDIFFPIHLYLKSTIDVLFSPAHYTPRFCPVPVVVTIHDTAYEYFPGEFLKRDLYKLKNWTAHGLKQAKKIIAVSQSTKKDIARLYNVDNEKISVIYNGYNTYETENKAGTDILNVYDVKKNSYILYVGTIQPRKNITALIEAFEKIAPDYPSLKLLIAGKKGWMYKQIYDSAQKSEYSGRMVFAGYVPDDHLSALYTQASMYVLPSLYEGFGIPILEAMNHGCPVIASDASSLPEVGKDACIYFDPKDTQDLSSALKKVLNSKQLQDTLKKKGKERVKHFSWDTCGSKTLALLKKAAR